MTPDLTLPGSIPGLLRRGSPVVMPDGERGTVCSLWSDEGVWALVVSCADLATGTGWSESTPTRKCALDLTDATGRAHAAWWALTKCNISQWPDLHTGARLWMDAALYDVPAGWDYARRKLWDILRNAGRIHDWLAHLDKSDPRTLPDGSRWVDAEALRLVVLHIAEVTDG